MFYVFLGLFMVLVFGLCFLIDKLIQKLTHTPAQQPADSIVRPARANVIWGIVLSVLGVTAALFLPDVLGWFAVAAGLILLFLGVYLLIVYCGTSICYDDDSFFYKQPGKRAVHYRFSQIRGETALLTRGGYNITIYVGDGEINLYSSMQGTRRFLHTAYQSWCRSRNLDPAQTPPPNPDAMVWFPEPEEHTDGTS